jgi:hypothetical protein
MTEPARFRCSAKSASGRAARMIEEVRFALDSLLEGDGFEPSVPRQKDRFFETPLFQHARHHRFENARRPVQQLLPPVVDPVRMNAELTRQLGDRPVPPTAATTPSL